MSSHSSLAETTPSLSLNVPSYAVDEPGDWRNLFERAKAAEDAGVDRIVVSDHVVFGENLEAYGRSELGGVEGGKQPTGPDGLWLEPMTVLAVLSAKTTRVRLATGVLQAALRRPVVLAKTAATLDVLSDGRLDLGVGIGWQKEEYDAAGLDFHSRGRALDETLAVCQMLWRDQRASYSGSGLSFEAIHLMPKPRQEGGVPIWVSGTVNPRVIERVVRFGTGWIPWGTDRDDPKPGIATMRGALEAAGRDPALLQVVGILPVSEEEAAGDLSAPMARVVEQHAIGVTDFRINLRIPREPEAATAALRRLVVAFRQAVGRAL